MGIFSKLFGKKNAVVDDQGELVIDLSMQAMSDASGYANAFSKHVHNSDDVQISVLVESLCYMIFLGDYVICLKNSHLRESFINMMYKIAHQKLGAHCSNDDLIGDIEARYLQYGHLAGSCDDGVEILVKTGTHLFACMTNAASTKLFEPSSYSVADVIDSEKYEAFIEIAAELNGAVIADMLKIVNRNAVE